MKKDIHPKYYKDAEIKCACGHIFKIGSTRPHIEIEICSACHPFYTGQERIIETGQVEKYRARLGKKGFQGPKVKKVREKKEKK